MTFMASGASWALNSMELILKNSFLYAFAYDPSKL